MIHLAVECKTSMYDVFSNQYVFQAVAIEFSRVLESEIGAVITSIVLLTTSFNCEPCEIEFFANVFHLQ